MMDVLDSSGIIPPPVFYQSTILERAKDENERKLERYLQTISKLSSGLSDRDTTDALNVHISKGHYEEVQLGLLSIVLTSSASAGKAFNALTLTNRDNLKCVRDCLLNHFMSKWRRLTEMTQNQIIWFTGELLKLGSNQLVHELIQSLFRNIAPGDLTNRNVWLAEAVLRILAENKPAIERQSFLVDCIVYCYLSIIVDHCHPSVAPGLRKAEIDFTVSLLREKWDECCGIGRDLVRLLHCVARIPEFESIWYDLLNNPTQLSPNFTGLVGLLRRRTSRRFLLLRITPDLEQKFFFVTTKVRMAGPFVRHLEWLKRSIIAAQGPTLRCELIRYICGLIHPSNEVISSDVIQRWYIIGWLLKCHPSAPPGDIALAKLALYFDWLGFDPSVDNFMNIEPGVLLIFHSRPQHSASNMGSVLLDFLCRLAVSFHPPVVDDVRNAMLTAFRHLQDKRVVPLPSIGMLFDHRHLEQDVYFLCRQTFPELLPQQPQQQQQQQQQQSHQQPASSSSSSGKFSDDEQDVVAVVSAASDALAYKPFAFVDEDEPLDELDEELMLRLGTELAQTIRQIAVTSDNEQRCQFVEDVLRRYQSLLESDDAVAESTADVIAALPTCFLSALRQLLFQSPLASLTPSQDQIEESLSAPHFVIFHTICNIQDEDDPARSSLVALVANMAAKQGRMVAHFLYFLAATAKQTEQPQLPVAAQQQLIRDLATASANKPSVESYLMGCLEFCQQTDAQLFVYLLPYLYATFRPFLFDTCSADSTNTLIRVLRLTCQVCDARQLAFLTSQVLFRHLVFFTEANACHVLTTTLAWETIEQMFAWQLFFAHHSISPTRLLPIVPKLKPDRHHEALTNLCCRFSALPPSTDLVSAVLSRSPSASELASPALLKAWADASADKLVDSLTQVLAAGQLVGSAGQRNRNVPSRVGGHHGRSAPGSGVSRDQLLAHLDRFRQTAADSRFLLFPPVQRLMQSIHQQATEHVKFKYSDLFTLIDEKLVNDTTTTTTAPPASSSLPASASTFAASQPVINSSSGGSQHADLLSSSSPSSSSASASSLGHHAHASGPTSTAFGNNSTLSALTLLDSVASSGVDGLAVHRLPSSSAISSSINTAPASAATSTVHGASKLRRVPKRPQLSSPSFPNAAGPKVTKFTTINIPSD